MKKELSEETSKNLIHDKDIREPLFDFNIAVVGTKHAGSIKEHIPEWWGVITVEEADGILDFYLYRKPQKNPKVDMKHKITILWRPELAHIQEFSDQPSVPPPRLSA